MLQRHAFAAAFLAVLGLSSAPASAATCDRACLGGMIDKYVDALLAHEPSKLPLTSDARYLEDFTESKIGEGAWKTVTAKTDFRHDYLDTTRQIAAAHLALKEGAIPALISVVLHVKDGKVFAVETEVQRIQPDSKFQPKELGHPVPGMNDPVPAGKRMSRAAMIATAMTYPRGLKIGSFVTGQTPFAKEGLRIENGVITAGDGCGRKDCGMQTQDIMKHPGITANVAAVDEEAGIVLLWMNFGYTGSYGPGNALVTFEAFKVWGGEIHAVNAFFRTTLPVATVRNWPSSDPIPAEP